MLKLSDYAAVLLSFLAMLALYLLLAGGLSINLGVYDRLTPLSVPEGYDPAEARESETPEAAVLCGAQADSGRTRDAAELLANLKMPYKLFSSAEEISGAAVDTVIITAERWDEIGDADALMELAGQGKKLIFSHLMTGPGSQERNRAIGVLHDRGPVEIGGVLLSEKLLIQGMVYHDSLSCSVSDVVVDGGCGKLMVEWTKEERPARDLIPLIWEKRYGEGWLYVINGGFLTGDYGMGILTGLLARTEEVFVYPVVNAKVNLLDSFPELNNPNEARIRELYSRDSNMFLRDIVWPTMVKLCEIHGLVISARMNVLPTEEFQSESDLLVSMMERRGCQVDEGPVDAGLPCVCRGHMRRAETIFQSQSSVSGMGLLVHYLDMAEVMGKNAEDPGFEWNEYSLELSKLTRELYQNTDWMDAVTLDAARERYARYMLLQPSVRLGEGRAVIETGRFDQVCYYIVRTEKKVSAELGCQVTRIGESAYLVKATSPEASVVLQEPGRS